METQSGWPFTRHRIVRPLRAFFFANCLWSRRLSRPVCPRRLIHLLCPWTEHHDGPAPLTASAAAAMGAMCGTVYMHTDGQRFEPGPSEGRSQYTRHTDTRQHCSVGRCSNASRAHRGGPPDGEKARQVFGGKRKEQIGNPRKRKLVLLVAIKTRRSGKHRVGRNQMGSGQR